MMTIHMSYSKVSAEAKTISTGFEPVVYTSVPELIKGWTKFAHSSAVFSRMPVWDGKRYIGKTRRRIHNTAFIGNTFVYDFDAGEISMAEFFEKYKDSFDFVAVKSRSDHKYEHDRFKVLVVHDSYFVHSMKTDPVPNGFVKRPIVQYKEGYINFAFNHGFWDYCDTSTKDLCRLIAAVGQGGQDYVTNITK